MGMTWRRGKPAEKRYILTRKMNILTCAFHLRLTEADNECFSIFYRILPCAHVAGRASFVITIERHKLAGYYFASREAMALIKFEKSRSSSARP